MLHHVVFAGDGRPGFPNRGLGAGHAALPGSMPATSRAVVARVGQLGRRPQETATAGRAASQPAA